MDALKRLAEDFPGWSVWRARAEHGPGDWYATRRAFRLSGAELNAGLCMTVCALTLDDLARVLDAQVELQADHQ
ncbi:hypothetical protein ACFXJ8_21175 [Nonomuraea sp. NPDC059194]|uniref:hypothetical protein n=1 Tax=Nonomuraea sp. NPDC059194 TaxID=3346764 RepID=UPI0036A2A2F5